MNRRRLLGVTAAACVGCCAAPLLLAAIGVTAVGAVGSIVLGAGALAGAGSLAAILVVTHRRRQPTGSTTPVVLGPARDRPTSASSG